MNDTAPHIAPNTIIFLIYFFVILLWKMNSASTLARHCIVMYSENCPMLNPRASVTGRKNTPVIETIHE